MAEIISFENFKRAKEQQTTPDSNHGFEIGGIYNFDPEVSSQAYWDEERTEGNFVGRLNFKSGECVKFLKNTEYGPLYLFKGYGSIVNSQTSDKAELYFGVIKSPKGSVAIKE